MKFRSLLFALAAVAFPLALTGQTPKPAAPGAGKPTARAVPYATIKVDRTLWKPRKEPLNLGDAAFTSGLDTPHYTIAGTAKVKPEVLAAFGDALERLWIDINSGVPMLGEVFGDRRMLILIPENKAEMEKLKDWYVSECQAAGWGQRAFGAQRDFMKSFSWMALRKEFAEPKGFHSFSRVFWFDALKAGDIRNPVWQERIHFVASTLLEILTEGVFTNGRYNLTGLKLVYSYYCEWRAAGKMVTEVAVGGEDVEGFKKGKNWFATIKGLLKKTSPSIESLIGSDPNELHPKDVGFGFGLMHYIHSNPEKLKAFGALLRQMKDDKKMMDAEGFSKALGFESAAALDAAWKQWMEGPDFR